MRRDDAPQAQVWSGSIATPTRAAVAAPWTPFVEAARREGGAPAFGAAPANGRSPAAVTGNAGRNDRRATATWPRHRSARPHEPTVSIATTLVDRGSQRTTMIVAADDAGETLGRRLCNRRSARHRAVRMVHDECGDVFQLAQRLRETAPREAYFVLGGAVDEHVVMRLGARLLMDGTAVHVVLPRAGRPLVRTRAVDLGTHWAITLHAVRDHAAGRVVRRALDVIVALAMLLVLAPVLLAVAALIWGRLGRPVLFTQQRLGLGGRLFRLYKFRSMVVGADDAVRQSAELRRAYVAAGFKLAHDDARITPLGRVLRASSLDELPQLWNVLRGDMTLVGPRAIVPEELGQYGDYGRMLLRIKPGLTGIWQVSGRSTIGYPERARMDLEYVAGRSLAHDLQILLRTVPAVLRRRGAL